MAQNRNYAKEFESAVEKLRRAGKRPRLLLHACCAPCSSAVLERVCADFAVTALFYNPNISPEAEYLYRAAEMERLLREMPVVDAVVRAERYDPSPFLALAQGLEDAPEGGARCMKCYRMRLERTAEIARAQGFDCFTTTLTISPMKNAAALNTIGEALAGEYGVPFLPSDFKKKDGYKRSIALSKQYGLYRQDFCGCIYSKLERERMKRNGCDT